MACRRRRWRSAVFRCRESSILRTAIFWSTRLAASFTLPAQCQGQLTVARYSAHPKSGIVHGPWVQDVHSCWRQLRLRRARGYTSRRGRLCLSC
jgi:hypothetical protein